MSQSFRGYFPNLWGRTNVHCDSESEFILGIPPRQVVRNPGQHACKGNVSAKYNPIDMFRHTGFGDAKQKSDGVGGCLVAHKGEGDRKHAKGNSV